MDFHIIFFDLANQKNKSRSSCYTPDASHFFFNRTSRRKPLMYSIQQNIQTSLPINQTLLFSDVTAVFCYSYPAMSVRKSVVCLDKDHLANNPNLYALNRYTKE